jgi:hypothetical protein
MLARAPLFSFQHGDHICVFYRTENALLEILSPYVAEGLRRGECCFCVQPIHIMQKLRNDLQFLGVKVDQEMNRGALLCYSEREIYFESGKFDPHGMIRKLESAIENSVRAGFTGFRSAGELSWAGDSVTHCKQVTGYEKMVEECYPSKPAVGLCQYRMGAFSQETLDELLESHKMQVIEPEKASQFASLHICRGLQMTEIVAAKKVGAEHYYYVVQQSRPMEIVGWGVTRDFETASEEADRLMIVGGD